MLKEIEDMFMSAVADDHIRIKLYSVAGFWLLSIVSILFGTHLNTDIDDNLCGNDIYQELLLVAIVVVGPKMAGLILDRPTRNTPATSSQVWSCKILLIIMLFLPDLTVYLLRKSHHQVSQRVFRSFNIAKIVGITGSLLCTISFEGRLEPPLIRSFNVLTTSFLLVLVAAEVFFVSEMYFTGPSAADLHFRFLMLTALGLGILFFAMLKLVRVLWTEITHWEFRSHQLKTQLCRALALLLFSGSALLLELTVPRNDSLTVILVLQVLLVFCLTVLQDQTWKALAQEKERQLEERLDLIRYISHEMRTPLNTASLGLESSLSSARAVKNNFSKVRSFLREEEERVVRGNGSPTSVTQDEAIHQANLRACLQKVAGMELELRDQVDSLNVVRDSCAVAVSTLDDILTIDKLDQGKLKADFADLNPLSFVRQMSKAFVLNAREKQVQFEVQCVDEETRWFDRWCVRGDAFKLGQVLRNLLSNALKFTPVGGTVVLKLEMVQVVDCSLNSESRSGGPPTAEGGITKERLRLSVTDSGVGISPENQKKLFKRYVQINPGQLQHGKGSGLGLWIARKIVEMHEGEIEVFSLGEGTGSTFITDLPLFLLQTPQGKDLASTLWRASVGDLENLGKMLNDKPDERQLLTSYDSLDSSFECCMAPSPPKRHPSARRVPSLSLLQAMKAAATTSETTSPRLSTPRWDAQLRFLVVDDSLMSCKLLKKALERCGHSVRTAEDGQACVDLMRELLEETQCVGIDTPRIFGEQQGSGEFTSSEPESSNSFVDVVLIDDNMPKMSGVEATGRLRALGFSGRIYGVTGDVSSEKTGLFLGQGADGVFPKPLDLEKLKITLSSG